MWGQWGKGESIWSGRELFFPSSMFVVWGKRSFPHKESTGIILSSCRGKVVHLYRCIDPSVARMGSGVGEGGAIPVTLQHKQWPVKCNQQSERGLRGSVL